MAIMRLVNLPDSVLGGLACRLLLATPAWLLFNVGVEAQVIPAPGCAIDPPALTGTTTVTGFAADRAYIHTKHPQLCADSTDRSCDASAYVIAGDSVRTSSDCGGWTYIEFGGKGKRTKGWVATFRVTSTSNPTQPVPAESMPPSTHPACSEVERLMNASLRGPEAERQVLPSALQHVTRMDQLPEGVVPNNYGQTWGGSVADANIQGHMLKVVSYSSGGTCSEGNLELWDFAFKNRVPIPSSNADNEEAADGYSSEDLVKVNGEVHFAHFSRYGDVTLARFDKNLSAHPLCRLTLSPSRMEEVKAATDSALCEAVRTGAVSGAPIQDIEPYELTPESFHFDAQGLELVGSKRNGLRIIARGHLDVDNDGKLEDVGILAFGNGVDTAGCGHDVDTVVPIKLNPDGTPMAASAFAYFTHVGPWFHHMPGQHFS